MSIKNIFNETLFFDKEELSNSFNRVNLFEAEKFGRSPNITSEHFFEISGLKNILQSIIEILGEDNLDNIFFEYSTKVSTIEDEQFTVFVCTWENEKTKIKLNREFLEYVFAFNFDTERIYPIYYHPDFFNNPQSIIPQLTELHQQTSYSFDKDEIRIYPKQSGREIDELSVLFGEFLAIITKQEEGKKELIKLKEVKNHIYVDNHSFSISNNDFNREYDKIKSKITVQLKEGIPEKFEPSIENTHLVWHQLWHQLCDSNEKVKSYFLSLPIVGASNSDESGLSGIGACSLFVTVKKEIEVEKWRNLTIHLDHLIKTLLLSYTYRVGVRQIEKIKHYQLRTAIISILVDSYAHNISAHSLVALEAWFKKRTLQLEKPIYVNDNPQDITFPNATVDRHVLKSISKISEEYYKKLGLDDHTNTNQYLTFTDLIRLEGINIEKLLTAEVNALDSKTNLVTGGRKDYTLPVPIDNVLWHFIRFIKGKAAFWSGVTRDLHFGGQHLSIFNLLFKEFAENSLYAGTIAATEEIYKLNIKIGLDKQFELNDKSGLEIYDFVQINTEIINEENSYDSCSNDFLVDDNIKYSGYGFLRFGKDFEKLRRTLSKEIVYMPNSIIGIHAFLTIIENTIRNVKHFKHDFDNIRRNGLTLIITFQKFDVFNIKFEEVVEELPCNDGLNCNYIGKHRLYRTGIAIGHKIKPLEFEDKMSSPFGTIKEKLFKGITDSDTGAPMLGGTSQDKICSAMLFNNKFSSVETINNARDWYVYPWTHPRMLTDDDVEEGKTYNRNYSIESRKDMLNEYIFSIENKRKSYKYAEDGMSNKGYLFKFFNIWRGETIKHLQPNIDNSLSDKFMDSFDNHSRFTFVIADSVKLHIDKLGQNTSKLRERDVYRIIEKVEFEAEFNRLNDINNTAVPQQSIITKKRIVKPNSELYEESAYKVWNRSILKDLNNKITIFELPDSQNPSLNPIHVYDLNGSRSSPDGEKKLNDSIDFGDIVFTHGSTQEVPKNYKNIVLNYRSHGVLIEKFAEINSYGIKDIMLGVLSNKIDEFIETLLVQVKIWDNRIAKKIPKDNILKYQKSLRLWFYSEEFTESDELKFVHDESFTNHTIYVVHLSLIEDLYKKRLQKDKSNLYIDWFIETFLMRERILYHEMSLCIVSGRGNDEWYKKEISPKYLPFVIFKPIESLTNAVVDAIDFKDDFQLKYNICKTLMG
ncbi:hypothetical protein VB796_21555 [Arcicella sp. LKC2W]|uniref:hypothetical protein n=1 Tax=Arcicella sp. LKC2W TaxID=2984198 RepID=UPI002B202508|nr:hypothetical protein [Arcicella sp. LKC2W]MEA5461669.1 hypothetical protein [Arcicella sp. LKC2W]